MPGRVFILGAGASKSDTSHSELSMPLATEFFHQAYLAEHWNSANPYQISIKFEESALGRVIQQYFASRSGKGEPAMPGVNVEEVYSFLENYRSVAGGRDARFESFEVARTELLNYVIGVVRYVPFNLVKPRLHTFIAKQIKSGDSILSFNWDLLLDNSLQRTTCGRKLLATQKRLLRGQGTDPKDNYSDVAYRQLHEGYLLKLHGSVNLAACVNKSCARHSSPYWFDAHEEMPEHWPCDSCGSQIEVLIIPPHANKSYAASRFFSLQASIAVGKLSHAEEIVVIGYSFPAFDLEARTMMPLARLDLTDLDNSETFLKRVVVVNSQANQPDYMQKVTDLFGLHSKTSHGHRVQLYVYTSVEEYLQKEFASRRRNLRNARPKPLRT